MGKYNGAVITAAGQNLIAQAIAESKTVTFTTAQASSHVYPSSTDFEALTALTDVEKTVDINYAGVYSDTVVQVSARFDNDGVETAYLINTLGFFAQLGTDAPILFAVSTAVTPDQMPVFDADNPSAFIYNMQMTVQNADSINLSVNPAGAVTVEQLNTVVSTINAKIGDLSDLTTDDKTSLVNSINEVDAHADAAQVSANIVQAQVSDSGDAYSPTSSYSVGDLVIYDNTLYRCITACSTGSWSVNSGCFVKDTLVNIINSSTDPIQVALREQRCINEGADGIIWDLDTLMGLVRNDEFGKFAIGDAFVDNGVTWRIHGKKTFPKWAFDGAVGETPNTITCLPDEALGQHRYNSSNTNAGGYAGSTMPAYLESTILPQLSAGLRTYIKETKIYENNKGNWAAVKRKMRIPTIIECTGNQGWADQFSGGTSSQLPLMRANRHRIKTYWYWCLDPVASNTTGFCLINSFGVSVADDASVSDGSVRPEIVLG